MEALFNEGSNYRIALFASIALGLWQRRNRMRVHQPALQLHEIGDRAKELVQEFLEVHKLDLPVVCRRPRARWHPPPLGCYKANVDAALFEGLDSMGIRVVFRDHEGCIIAALNQRVRLPQSIEMAEALAARKVVVFAKELSLSDVIIEGDCLRVAQARAASGRCNTLFGQVIEETRQIRASLQQCQFLHVRREGNRLAHALVRRAISTANTDVRVEELSSDLDAGFQSDFL